MMISGFTVVANLLLCNYRTIVPRTKYGLDNRELVKVYHHKSVIFKLCVSTPPLRIVVNISASPENSPAGRFSVNIRASPKNGPRLPGEARLPV